MAKENSTSIGDSMRLHNLTTGVFAVSLCGFSVVQQTPAKPTTNTTTTPLILEKPEGERRVHRSAGTTTGTAPFILKVDPKNSSSQHLVMFTEDLPPGAAIPRHKHPESEEILILQTGRSRVHLGDVVKEVGPGATVFIHPDTWISAEVIGNEPVSVIAIFSEPGFEEYMRAISIREGETNTPMSRAELDAVRAQHPHAVNYK
jgi:quercetin dioxygenase-like cupin family protein